MELTVEIRGKCAFLEDVAEGVTAAVVNGDQKGAIEQLATLMSLAQDLRSTIASGGQGRN